jgi:hypothetical protein
MITSKPHTIRIPPFPASEQARLLQLRACYRQDRDLFSRPELARLRFLRWLSQKGHDFR